MASTISRRLTSKLLNPSSSSALFSLYPSSYHTNPNNSHQSLLNPTPNFTDFNHRSSFPRIPVSPNHSSIRSHTSFDPSFKIQSLSPNLYQPPKFFSTSTPQSDPEETQKPNENPTQTHFRWTQEITGPTVERDVSTLANETRQALDEMFKTNHNFTKGFAIFGLIQLGLGTWISFAKSFPYPEVFVLSFLAFGLPFSLSFSSRLRRSQEAMGFIRKMEEQGRLQSLTRTLQEAKYANACFVRRTETSYWLFSVACYCSVLMNFLDTDDNLEHSF